MAQGALAAPQGGQVRRRSCPSCSLEFPSSAPPPARCTACGASTAIGAKSPGESVPAVVTLARPRARLNPAQDAAVHLNGNLLITACPGSGKTFVLRERAIRKLMEHPKAQGIAVTFTRDAASELESRVMMAYPEGAGRMVCGTFHSLCKRQLKQAGINVNLINDVQQSDLLHRAWKDIVSSFVRPVRPSLQGSAVQDEEQEITYDAARIFVEDMKSRVHPVLGNPADCPYTQIYLRYQELLRQRESMDFSDMLVMVTQKMATGEVQPLIGSGGFMLVDEAQDCDSVQLGWVKAHMQQGLEIAVVGDDDQAIYGFRFSQGFQGLDAYRDWARARHISLDTTYRCAHEILVPAGRLILNNSARIPKELRTENLTRGEVCTFAGKTLESQVLELERYVRSIDEPRDWGIIVRTNRIADEVEKIIKARTEAGAGFELTRSGGKSFWDLQGPSLYLGLCRSLWFDEMIGIDAILRLAGVTEARISCLHQELQSRKRGSLTAFLLNGASGRSSEGEDRFRRMAGEWRNLMRRGRMSLATAGITRYMNESLNLVPPGSKDHAAMSNATRRSIEAAGNAIAAIEFSKTPVGQGLRSIGQDNLPAKADEHDASESANAARLLTFHSSKGLEFKNVWLLGCDEGVIPSKNSENEAEERRLFYVGMTRAKQRLFISYTASKMSSFITEAGL